MKIAALGPEGTFSHAAVLAYDKQAKIVFYSTLYEVFEAVDKGEVVVGIVPIENSLSGTIGLTTDALMKFDVSVNGEVVLPINHHLAGTGKMGDITSVYVQPQTHDQCASFIREHLYDAQILMTQSNADSAQNLQSNEAEGVAAIVPSLAIDHYGLKIIQKNIQDYDHNMTRFFVIGKKSGEKSGKDKTSIAVTPIEDAPGLLHSLLSVFADRSINLTKMESRPAKSKLGDYVFFIDFQGHRDDENIIDAFVSIEKKFSLKVLGSYPEAY
ncbi:MAG: prephenate dehydratase [Nanoarchaeota archaeon]|nr:prephenate dehydratase [Nanoarchaeota archaeon]